MVPATLNLGAVQGCATGDDQAIGQFLAGDAERAEDVRHRCDTVALFDAELRSVADLSPPFGDRGQRADRGNLVDHADDELPARN